MNPDVDNNMRHFAVYLIFKQTFYFLTNHSDRSNKGTPRGCSGILLDWELNTKEPATPKNTGHYPTHLPGCVCVKFESDLDEEKNSTWVVCRWTGQGGALHYPQTRVLASRRQGNLHTHEDQAASAACCTRLWAHSMPDARIHVTCGENRLELNKHIARFM